MDRFETGIEAQGQIDGMLAGDFADGRTIHAEEDVFDHARTSVS